MNKTLTYLMATAAVTLATSAYAADAQVKSKIDYKKNGGYEATRTSEGTNANGTAVSSESNVDVDVDSKGLVDKTVKVEHKSDAKGLMNAKDDSTTSHVEDKSNGGFKHETKHKSSNAAGTDTSEKSSTDVDVDSKGNVTSTETIEKTTDPKGLLNEKTSTSKVKTLNGQVIERKKSN